MERKLYFTLLLCAILSQGICISSNVNNETSSDIHIRQKRVIGGSRHHPNDAPYLVTILLRGNHHCPASLLTEDTAITSAHCFKNQDVSRMSLESRKIGGKRFHHIVRLIFLDPQYNDARPTFKNLVLVKFNLPVHLPTSLSQPIRIHSGSIVEERLQFEIVTWGKPFQSGRGNIISLHLRKVPVQPISIQYCQQIYPGLIGPGNICTSAVNFGQHACEFDSGAPLIVEQNLMGIMAYHGPGRSAAPDVFMNLMDPDIRRWIHQHVPSLRLF